MPAELEDLEARIVMSKPGWLERDGVRVCLVDGESGLNGVHLAYFDEVGVGAWWFLYQAGMRAAAGWREQLPADCPIEAVRVGLDLVERGGYGQLRLGDTFKDCCRLSIVAEDSFESWSFLRHADQSKNPVCSYTAGLLAGLWCVANERCRTDAPQSVCWEVECVAKGDPQCRFEIGSEEELLQDGFEKPQRAPSLRWEFQALSRRLQFTDHQLDSLAKDLARRDQAYQSLIDNMNDILLVLDDGRRVVFCNNRFLESTGLTLDEALGTSPLERINPEDRESVNKIYDQLIAGEISSAVYQFRVDRPQGTIHLESSARAMTGVDGKRSIQVIGRDVTEQRQAHNQLEQTHRQLVRKQKIADNDLRVAKMVHESLLPKPVEHSKISIDVKYVPYDRVGGDYVDLAIHEDRECLMTLCDVSGHGMAAALMASRVSSYLRAMVKLTRDPLEITRKLNGFLVHYFEDTGLFVTFLAVLIDLETLQASYCSSGHPGPILLRDDAQTLDGQNLPVGIVQDSFRDSSKRQIQLQAGDRLVLYTDGIPETLNAQMQPLSISGTEKLVKQGRDVPLFEFGDWLLGRVGEFRHGDPADDMTLLIAELHDPE